MPSKKHPNTIKNFIKKKILLNVFNVKYFTFENILQRNKCSLKLNSIF